MLPQISVSPDFIIKRNTATYTEITFWDSSRIPKSYRLWKAVCYILSGFCKQTALAPRASMLQTMRRRRREKKKKKGKKEKILTTLDLWDFFFPHP